MEWLDKKNDVAESELPLELKEQIARYDVLKAYNPHDKFILGVGIGLSLYMEKGNYYEITNANFTGVVAGYEMKHGAVVNSRGDFNFQNIDAFLAETKTNGLHIDGHTLVWHTNQNASYLNGLIAPEVIPGTDGDNLLINGDFEDGAIGWGSWGSGKTSVEAVSDVKLGGEQSLKVVTTAGSSNLWDVQIQAPEVPLVVGHEYQISFWIKSEGSGGVRISFGSNGEMSSQYPWHTEGEYVSTTSTWKQVIYDKTTIDGGTFTAVGNKMQLRIDMGKFPNMTYYIDNATVVDLDAAPSIANLISNGNFENGSISPWGSWGNGSSSRISNEGEGYGNQGYAMVLINPAAAQSYSAQAAYEFESALKNGQKYKATAMVKSSVSNGAIQMQVQNASYGGQYSGGRTIGLSWTEMNWEFTASTNDRIKFIFDFGEVAATYYIDNVVLQEIIEKRSRNALRSGPVIIEKTPEEKAEIIDTSMESWISQMVGRYKGDIKAWDVVNEPMDDGRPSELKTGIYKNPEDFAADEFYWQDYLGKDYAVKAFNLTRQYGNSTDILFINDYNLEYNLAKCDGLIEYVKYIESKGAKVDGIGTQMHISINTNKGNIAEMFKKLAASGKIIKVSELDIKVETSTPTAAQLAQQADMYQYVIDMYKQHIPVAQQYGITLWGISDNAIEHEYWIPDDAPNVWDKNYERKHSYKGVANGLAGKDVSAEFSGRLQ
jgi:GH35 family endo-1,4-beta-xylanase